MSRKILSWLLILLAAGASTACVSSSGRGANRVPVLEDRSQVLESPLSADENAVLDRVMASIFQQTPYRTSVKVQADKTMLQEQIPVRNMVVEDATWLYLDSYKTYDANLDERLAWLGSEVPDEPDLESLGAVFRAQNRSCHSLLGWIKGKEQLLSLSSLDIQAKDPFEFWSRLFAAAPSAGALVKFARPAVSEDGNKALVWVSVAKGAMSVRSTWLILHKVKGEWEIVKAVLSGMS